MTTSPPPDTITRLLDAVYPSFALLAGMALDLFTPLDAGPLSAEQLAATLDVPVLKLRPLLYALAVAGILAVEGDQFANTPEAARYLVRGGPDYVGGTHELTAANWSNMINLAATVRASGTRPAFDYHAMPHKELVALFRGLNPGAVRDAHRLMAQVDFSAYKSVVDVGGGSGALAIAIAQAQPHLAATVVDLPQVTPITRQFVEEAHLSDRISIRTADVVREPLSGDYDAIVARHVIQVLSAEDSRALLRNLAAAVTPGGTLHLIGWILDDSRLTPPKTVNYNLILLSGYDEGQAYTEQEYRAWLGDAGFEGVERVVFPDGASLISARKPH